MNEDDDSGHSYLIEISQPSGRFLSKTDFLTQAVLETLRFCGAIGHAIGGHAIGGAAIGGGGIGGAEISVALVDDHQIAEINQRYLNHAGATDVISFNLSEPDASGSPCAVLEGELVISVETADREAGRRGLSVESELSLYAVHGCLHLLGYDDGSPAEAERMRVAEEAVLVRLGYGSVFGVGVR
jgi:probable rRNA maturation factor